MVSKIKKINIINIMKILIVENNFLLKENFFSQLDLKLNLNLLFSSSILKSKRIISKEKIDLFIISSIGSKFNSFKVIDHIFDNKPKKKIIQVLDKINDNKHEYSSFYLKKPINFNKLLSFIIKPKKKTYQRKKLELKNGLVFKRYQRKLLSKINKKEIILTEKESDILNFLFKEKKFVKKMDLLHSIWGFNNKVKTRTLETHIYRLRKKIYKNFGIKQFILVQNNSYKIVN